MNLTFLATDQQDELQLLKRTTTSDTPNVEAEWQRALQILLGASIDTRGWCLVGALQATPDQRIRWYPDQEDKLVADQV